MICLAKREFITESEIHFLFNCYTLKGERETLYLKTPELVEMNNDLARLKLP